MEWREELEERIHRDKSEHDLLDWTEDMETLGVLRLEIFGDNIMGEEGDGGVHLEYIGSLFKSLCGERREEFVKFDLFSLKILLFVEQLELLVRTKDASAVFEKLEISLVRFSLYVD